jgi:uncharacterized membrane protein YtjA (UPF0391 family)
VGFFVVALLAALFGFTDLAAGAAWIGRFLCFLFLAAFVLAFTAGIVRVRLGRVLVIERVTSPADRRR